MFKYNFIYVFIRRINFQNTIVALWLLIFFCHKVIIINSKYSITIIILIVDYFSLTFQKKLSLLAQTINCKTLNALIRLHSIDIICSFKIIVIKSEIFYLGLVRFNIISFCRAIPKSCTLASCNHMAQNIFRVLEC